MREITIAKAINEALDEEMERDERVYFVGEDIGKYHRHNGPCGVSTGLIDKYGTDRVVETPIAEQLILGTSSGAAMFGMRPVVEIMQAEFTCCGFEHITFGASKAAASGAGHPFPMVIRAPYGGHIQGQLMQDECVEGWYMSVPGLKIVMPSTPEDAKGLLKSAIRDDYPVLFLEHHFLYKNTGEVPEEEYLTPLGKGKILHEGTDVSVITYGRAALESAKAADVLEGKGISAEIIDLRTVKPFDRDMILKSVKKTGRAVVCHEARKHGGAGAEIASFIMENAFADLKKPVLRIAGPDVPSNFPVTEPRITAEIEKFLA